MAVLQGTTCSLKEDSMREIVDVNTGQIKIGMEKMVLRSLAIGSCVVISAYDLEKGCGGLAHVMLPGRAPLKSSESEKTKYAADAIDELIYLLKKAKSGILDIVVCLVGAGNVLKKKDDTICRSNIESISQILKQKNIPITAAVLGGTKRKSVFFDIDKAYITYTEGEGKEILLWQGAKH
jgi:chemotaxis protein CheD